MPRGAHASRRSATVSVQSGTNKFLTWVLGVAALSFVAAIGPIIIGSAQGKSVPFNHVFGGAELVITGVVIMVAGTLELHGTVVRPKHESLSVWTERGAWVLMLVGAFIYAGRVTADAEAPASGGQIAEVLIVFVVTVGCGTAAALLATGW
ncbi:hypothetical protein [Streptomyces sp. TLI_053]|uniref:hypothetical protein n=1 Tax=Streptomyces sp. TLI_053 TaxID=1855352 RepID=UPI001352088A|nr:hypothetical protein [Streptomyces sp. TLI_053]